ncbi:MAG: hypothetical protein DYH02_06985 [Candidatus Omnitrophica bacterium COP1]|nr:hypothetical protein [Candidatus Omnitrophica bacterium COP1]
MAGKATPFLTPSFNSLIQKKTLDSAMTTQYMYHPEAGIHHKQSPIPGFAVRWFSCAQVFS